MGVQCYSIDVDGEPVTVRLAKSPAELSEEELEAIRGVIRTARRNAAMTAPAGDEPPRDQESIERELAYCVSEFDALPPHHPRRVPLSRRIKRLSRWAQREQEQAR